MIRELWNRFFGPKLKPEPSIYFLKAKSIIDNAPLDTFEEDFGQPIPVKKGGQESTHEVVHRYKDTIYFFVISHYYDTLSLTVGTQLAKDFMPDQEKLDLYTAFVTKMRNAREFTLRKALEDNK